MLTISVLCLLAGSLSGQGDPQGVALFERKIRPVLAEKCWSCHATKAKMSFAGLQFDTKAGLWKGSDAGAVVVAGKPEESRLWKALTYEGAIKMPPSGKLPPEVLADFRGWIERGAPWPDEPAPGAATSAPSRRGADHWAWKAVAASAPPEVRDTAWPLDPIDRFVLSKLEQRSLHPVGDASRELWLRRVAFDVTGLPPSPEQQRQFLADNSPRAHANAVDRLLAAPAFGQRWGRHWLDQTYYSDNIEIGRRVPARHAWRYRDYVIDSINRDLPYDRFIVEQLAGEQLDWKTPEERRNNIVATGFLALGPWPLVNADKEQLRMDVVDLQVDLIGRSVLGLTLGCARCHDHKFDPVTNKDYYAMAGVFLSTKTTSRVNGEGGINMVRLPETTAVVRAHADALEAWDKRVSEVEKADKVYKKEQEAVRKTIDELKKSGGDTKAAEAELAQLKKKTEYAGDRQIALFARYMKPKWPEVYAAEDMEFPEDARIAARGDAHQLGDFVPRGFLKAVPSGAPTEIDPHSSGRKELADWLTDAKNPLPARVYVNRLWHHLFGVGIVATTDNFGSRGEAPSHPELLDYLAARLVEEGWSTKKLIREIVLSRVYQLASKPDSKAAEIDADNRYLWRANRRRLEAEAIRDTVLQISGRLDSARGGPSLPLTAQNVHTIAPYFLEDDSLVEPHVKHRRTVYQPIMRNSQMTDVDILNLFDFKDPDQIVGTRVATTVPTQMLYLMNSPFLKEESRRLAERLLADQSLEDSARVSRIVMAALSRPATARDQEQARQFIAEFKGGSKLEAWARFCHAIFVSSEFLYRR